jgi:phosphoglycerol transferase MdoB-like AlkP superfamily enzyme
VNGISARARASSAVLLVALAAWAWLAGARMASASPGRLSFSVTEDDTPARMCPAEPRPVEIELENDGDVGWQPSAKDRLAYHWLHEDGEVAVFEGERTELPGVVAPGQRVRLSARLVAPETPGRYRLAWAMVREGVRWFPPGDATIEVEVEGTALALALDVASIEPPATWGAGERATVPVVLDNRGCAAWSSAQGDALTYRLRDAATGDVVVEEGVRTPLPDTPPGERVRVLAEVDAPVREGEYLLELRAVREHLAWFRDPPEASGTAMISVGPSPLRWAYAAAEPVPALAAGDRVALRMRLRNVGTRTWSHAEGDRLSYRIRGQHGELEIEDGVRTRLPGPVAPGESVEVLAHLEAPREPGRYVVHWEMVREGVRWFGAPADGPDGVPVEVGPPRLAWSLVHAEPPVRAWAGRSGTLEVTVRNEGTEAWSSERGDRLSYRWRDLAGHVVVGEGERTLLPHEVAPGETVTLAMRVVGPPAPGRHVLELDLVREHVAWFGGPRDGTDLVFAVSVHRLADVALLLLGLFTVGLVIARRELESGPRTRGRARIAAVLDACLVPVWAAACVYLVAESFADYGGVPMWSGARAVALSGALLFALPLVAIPGRARIIAAWVLVTGLATLALADLGYMHFFGSIVPLTALAAVHHLGDASETVGSLMQPHYAWLLVLPLSGLVLAVARPKAPRAVPRAITLGVALLFAIGAVPAAYRLAVATTGELGVRVFNEQDNVGRLGLVNAHLFELSRGAVALVAGPRPLAPEDREALHEFFAERARARAEPTPGTGRAAGANVLLVQVEALQGWAVEARVGGQAVMPFLAGAADDGALWFRRVHDQTAQGRTSDAEYLALASGHPLRVGALCFLRADNGFRTLAHVAAEHGASTLSAHPYKRGFWNRAVLHPRYGFEDSIFRRELGDGPVIGWGLSDSAFFERLVPRVSALDEPFFAFAITLSLHHPYDSFPAAFQRLDLGELQGTRVGNYLHAMHHFDAALRQMLEDLEAAGLLDRTLVVVYGDHVSRLEEPPEVLALAGLELWDPSVPTRLRTVPVFAWVPGGAEAGLSGVRDRVGGQIDIGPTILDLLGRSDALPSAVGRSLLSEGPGFAALSDGSAIGQTHMFVAGGRDIPRVGACFDAVTGAAHPREACSELVLRAKEELVMSRRVLHHDLHREIGAR